MLRTAGERGIAGAEAKRRASAATGGPINSSEGVRPTELADTAAGPAVVHNAVGEIRCRARPS